MATYQRQADPAQAPTDVDWAWAAGFLEGEGSFCPMSGTDKRARVSANQKESEPLARLLMLFGGRIYKLKKKEMYIWMLRGNRARDFLMHLLPLMCSRRQGQINKTLEAAFSVEHGSKERYMQLGNIKPFLGRKHSIETRDKMSASRKAYFARVAPAG